MQNQRISLQALTEYAKEVASQSTATRMSINHDRTMLPIGKILSGSLKKLDNGETALEVLIDDFANEFVSCEGPSGETLYFAESDYDSRPFTNLQAKRQDALTIMINPLDFDRDDFTEMVALLQNDYHACVETTIAKGWVPNPEIVFNLISGFLLFTFGKQTLSKASDKLSDAVADDFVKFCFLIKKIIKIIAQKIGSRRQTFYIFSEPDQPVELVVKAKKADTVLMAFEALKEYDVSDKVQQFNNYTNGNLEKIQFTYDETTSKWELTYLTTTTGQVIGTEPNYKRTIEMYHSILKEPTAGFSVGGIATFDDPKDDDHV